MKINPFLVQDCDITDKDLDREEVKRCYVARVLTKGNWKDHQNVGFENIRKYLPEVAIPQEKRAFWEWYFKNGEHYANSN
jgi:hypothetical protein